MCMYFIFIILLTNYEKDLHVHNYRFCWKGMKGVESYFNFMAQRLAF